MQLYSRINSLGKQDARTHEDAGGYLYTSDINQTWQKIVQLLSGFVQEFTDKDLEATKLAEDVYIRLLEEID